MVTASFQRMDGNIGPQPPPKLSRLAPGTTSRYIASVSGSNNTNKEVIEVFPFPTFFGGDLSQCINGEGLPRRRQRPGRKDSPTSSTTSVVTINGNHHVQHGQRQAWSRSMAITMYSMDNDKCGHDQRRSPCTAWTTTSVVTINGDHHVQDGHRVLIETGQAVCPSEGTPDQRPRLKSELEDQCVPSDCITLL